MARVTTWDGKVYDVPNENVNAFLEQYNSDTNYTYKSPNPEVNQERGANLGGVVRAGLQGIPAVGSYADEAEAGVRAAGDALVQEMMYQQERRNDPKPTPQIPGLAGQFIQGVQNFQDTQKRYNEAYNKSYDKYLKNARESFEGALENIPEYAYPAYIGTGIAGEAAIAALTGGASLHPAVQGLMGAAYGYGMGEGAGNRAIDAGIVGTASAALPIAGKYVVAPAGKAIVKGGKNLITKAGEKIMKRKIPNTIEALKNTTSESFVTPLYKDANGEAKINVLSSLMEGAKDYPTQAKVATELVKETPKNAGLYKSGIMDSVDELARKGWKNQVADAIDDISDYVTNKSDKDILKTISDKLSKATKTTIESVDNALEEVELKDVREIVNYAIDKFGKDLSKETRDLLEKRMISEGMAKRVSNKLVNKSLAPTKSAIREGVEDLLWGLASNAILPGSGLITVLGKNALRGGTISAGKRALERTAAEEASKNIGKVGLSNKAARKSMEKALSGEAGAEAIPVPKTNQTTSSIIRSVAPFTIKQLKDAWKNRPIPLRGVITNTNTYYQPIIQTLSE